MHLLPDDLDLGRSLQAAFAHFWRGGDVRSTDGLDGRGCGLVVSWPKAHGAAPLRPLPRCGSPPPV